MLVVGVVLVVLVVVVMVALVMMVVIVVVCAVVFVVVSVVVFPPCAFAVLIVTLDHENIDCVEVRLCERNVSAPSFVIAVLRPGSFAEFVLRERLRENSNIDFSLSFCKVLFLFLIKKSDFMSDVEMRKNIL